MIEIITELVADPARDEDGWQHRLWNIELVNRTERDGEYPPTAISFVTEFRTGMALGEPTAEDVLESLLMDAQGVRFEGVDEWIESYGFEINSIADARRLEEMYKKIEEQSKALGEFLGGQDVLAGYLDMDADMAAKEIIREA